MFERQFQIGDGEEGVKGFALAISYQLSAISSIRRGIEPLRLERVACLGIAQDRARPLIADY